VVVEPPSGSDVKLEVRADQECEPAVEVMLGSFVRDDRARREERKPLGVRAYPLGELVAAVVKDWANSKYGCPASSTARFARELPAADRKFGTTSRPYRKPIPGSTFPAISEPTPVGRVAWKMVPNSGRKPFCSVSATFVAR